MLYNKKSNERYTHTGVSSHNIIKIYIYLLIVISYFSYYIFYSGKKIFLEVKSLKNITDVKDI